MKGTQVFGPYGKARYAKGTINTANGFTGQYTDGLTGLDYYHARYYDPVAGVFLSADSVQGNGQGMNPYAYVSGNPETWSDPTGRYVVGVGGERYYPPVVSPSNPPSQPKHSLGSLAAREQQTYNIAKSAGEWFYSVAAHLSLPGGWNDILGIILTGLGVKFSPYWAGIAGAIAIALARIAGFAADIANGFKQETDQVDLRSGQGLGYFNRFNVASAGDQILNNLRVEDLETVGPETGIGILAAVAALMVPDPDPISHGAIAAIAVAMSTGALTAGMLTAAGAFILYNVAYNDIEQEKNTAPKTGNIMIVPQSGNSLA